MTRRVFVNLGEIYFGQGDIQVETLLGSCVAITFWHPGKQLGGLCHFLLPERLRPLPARQRADEPDGRYGDEALSILLEQARRSDTKTADYVVKVFGGGSVLDLPAAASRVGKANVEFALDILQRHQINISALDIAGEGYRYLRFDLTSGDVWVRRGHGVTQKTEKVRVRKALEGVEEIKDQL